MKNITNTKIQSQTQNNENTTITEKDLAFIKDEFAVLSTALTLQELAQKLAYKKNASQLNQEVKKYDPYCRYEINDLICKEYDEPLMVSSKGVEPFKGLVVLKVIQKIVYPNFDCEMLEVDFTGGGTFRKHIDYMKKTKTQVLLPSSMEGKALDPEKIKKEEDPRMRELPMTEKDLRTLEKNLGAALSKSDEFFSWNNLWQLSQRQIKIPENTVKKIETRLQQAKQSMATTDIITNIFKVEPSDDKFDLYCLSLNYNLEKKYKKRFIFVSPINWGKWSLKETLNSFMKDIPLAAPRAKLPPLDFEAKSSAQKPQKFPLKAYLTWREVLSGGVTIPKALNKELSGAREYIFTDAESGDQYTTYYYPKHNVFLGLSDFYKKNMVTQGASLTIEKKELTHFKFTLKKSKKKISAPLVTYDPKKDRFSTDGEESLTSSLPNKIIYLESATLSKLFTLYKNKEKLNLQELLILIFKNFGMEGEALSLHFQRAFHLLDMLKHTTLEDVETILCSSHEFIRSEKKYALFLYLEKIKSEDEIEKLPADEEEILKPFPVGRLEEAEEEEGLPEIGTVGEIETPEVILEESIPEKKEVPKKVKKIAAAPEPPAEVTPEKPLEIKPPEPKKEKEPKKKKHKVKVEPDKALRRRKGEKRIIEERIELEESELEALFAVKAKTKKEPEVEKPLEPAEQVAKEAFTAPDSGGALSGIFGEKLKSALSKAKEPEKTKEEKAPAKDSAKAKKEPKAKTTPKVKSEPKKEAKKK